MSTFSASVATTGLALLLFAAAIPAQAQNLSQTQPQTQPETQPQSQPEAQGSLSRVRIVRISEVRGAAQLDRGIGDGYETAITNMPVVQQNRLKTDMGVAEVEFEDNSTLRIGPYSEVDFYLLGRTDEGNTVSKVRLVKGIAYVSLVKTGGKQANVFDLAFGNRNLSLQPDTHVRLEMNGQQAKLAVLGGKVQVQGPDQAVEVSHKRTATFALADDTPPQVAKGIEAESLLDSDSQSRLDSWDKNLDEYHSRRASMSAFGGVPYSYGVSDMMYYGAFQDMGGGCGSMWRPYFASAAWDPYSSGTWAYYSGAGYSWVSPYPWGWTPYHYGSWSFCPGAGWGWMPGGSWMGLNNIASATAVRSPNGFKLAQRLPVAPHGPGVGRLSMVPVNRTSLVRSGIDSNGSFVFRKDSAGLGVPRHVLGNLRGFSGRAIHSGMATMPIYMRQAPGAPNGMRGERNAPGSIAARRGNAPSNRGGFSNARPAGNMSSAPRGEMGNSMPMRSAPSAPAPAVSAPSAGRGH